MNDNYFFLEYNYKLRHSKKTYIFTK